MKVISFKKCVLTAALGVALSTQASASGLTDRLIIKYKEGVDVQQKALNMSKMSNRVAENLTHAKFMYNGSQVVKLGIKKSKKELQTLMKKIASDPAVEFVEEDRMMHPTATANDTYYHLQWHYHDAVAGIGLEQTGPGFLRKIFRNY